MEGALVRISKDIINYKHEKVVKSCREALESGHSKEEVVESLVDGIKRIARIYKEDDYYLPDIIMAGETFGVAMDFLYPMLLKKESGVIVMGTVKGSIHDSGKNLLRDLLRGSGYRVYDLGVNVEPERFVEEIKEEEARVLCMGIYMSRSRTRVEEILRRLKKIGIRDRIKILIGGYSVGRRYAHKIKVDAYAEDVFKGAEIVRDWMEKEKEETPR
ncbi:MAG: cobalamin-dependent protein [Candidatus Hydrothermarchaeales archaeon]